MHYVISLAVQVILLIIGSLLGAGYKHPLYFYWLVVSAIFVISAQLLNISLRNTKQELQVNKDKITTLTLLKENNNNNIVQVAVYPENKLIANKEQKINVYITSAVSITNRPDLKIKTEQEWDIKVFNQIQSARNFAGKYEYVLQNSFSEEMNEKFIKYCFFVNFVKEGNYDFEIELDNGKIKGNLINSLEVTKS